MSSVSEALMGKRNYDTEDGGALVVSNGWTTKVVLGALMVTLGSFNFGYNISVINAPAIIFKDCGEGGKWLCFPVPPSTWGFVVSIMSIGALLGSLMTGGLANKYGRRRCLIGLNVPYIAGSLILAFSVNSLMLLVGRFLIGLGVGASCIVVPMFLSEISTVRTRGQLTSAHQLMISVGLLFVELLALSGLAAPGRWRILFGFPAIPAAIQMAAMIWHVPESPRFLVQAGDVEGARRCLGELRAGEWEEGELEEMVREGGKDNSGDGSSTGSWGLMKLLGNWSLVGRSLTAAVLLHVAQQFSGINVIFYFSSILFSSPGGASSTSSTVPAAISLLNLVMTMVSIWLVERTGRRPLVLSSCIGMLLSGTAFTVSTALVSHRLTSIISILAFVSAFAVGMGPIPWLMMNELFPTQALAAAVTMAVGVNWGCNFVIGSTFEWIRALLGKWLFLPYTLSILLFTVYAVSAIPETKGRPIGFL